MIGTVMLEHLEVNCIVGIHPHERVEPQSIFVDVEFDIDFEEAAATEDVSNTVDYSEVAEQLTNLAAEKKYQLIETYAEEAATLVLDRYQAVRVMVKIKKPEAVPAARWAAVKVERKA